MNWILLTLTYLLTCAQWALLPKILVARETAFASPQHLNHSRNALCRIERCCLASNHNPRPILFREGIKRDFPEAARRRSQTTTSTFNNRSGLTRWI